MMCRRVVQHGDQFMHKFIKHVGKILQSNRQGMVRRLLRCRQLRVQLLHDLLHLLLN